MFKGNVFVVATPYKIIGLLTTKLSNHNEIYNKEEFPETSQHKYTCNCLNSQSLLQTNFKILIISFRFKWSDIVPVCILAFDTSCAHNQIFDSLQKYLPLDFLQKYFQFSILNRIKNLNAEKLIYDIINLKQATMLLDEVMLLCHTLYLSYS